MGAYKRQLLAAEECQLFDDQEHLRDWMAIEADAYEEAQLLNRHQGASMRQQLRFAIGCWHRLAGLSNKAEAQGSSTEIKNVIHRAIALCESQIQRLGGEVPILYLGCEGGDICLGRRRQISAVVTCEAEFACERNIV